MLMKSRHFIKERSSMFIFVAGFLLILLIIFIVGSYSSFAL